MKSKLAPILKIFGEATAMPTDGLTPEEASERARKGWETRHARGEGAKEEGVPAPDRNAPAIESAKEQGATKAEASDPLSPKSEVDSSSVSVKAEPKPEQAKEKTDVPEKSANTPEPAKVEASKRVWTDMPVPARKEAWAKTSEQERDTAADAPRSVRADIAEALKGAGERPPAGPEAVRQRLTQAGDIIGDKSKSTINRHVDKLGADLRELGVKPEAAHKVMMDATDAMVAQEQEALGRTLGDHGTRHILGNNAIAQQALEFMPGTTTEDRVVATLACVYHDTGYLTPPAKMFLDDRHPQWSQQHFDANVRPEIEATLGKGVADRVGAIIASHDSVEMDWAKDPTAAAVRMADNISVFHKEKMPALFHDVPANLDVMTRLYKKEIDSTEARKQCESNVRASDLPDSQKSQLSRAVLELNDTTPKLILGMVGGEIGSMEFKNRPPPPHPVIGLVKNERAEIMNQMLDLGQSKFDKFAKGLGGDAKSLRDNDEITVGKGAPMLKITVTKKRFSSVLKVIRPALPKAAPKTRRAKLFSAMLLCFAGTTEGALLGWITRRRGDGASEEQIHKELVAKGGTDEEVKDAMSKARKPEEGEKSPPEKIIPKRPWVKHVAGMSHNTLQDNAASWVDKNGKVRWQINNPARLQIHNDYAAKELAAATPVPPELVPVAIITMGGPASGKSGVTRGMQLDNIVRVDADRAREALPEYQEALAKSGEDAAQVTHKESSMLAGRVLNEALEQRKNIMYDGTGKDAKKYEELISRLKAAGYRVQVIALDLDIDRARARAERRAEEEGRKVPEDVIQESYANIPNNYMRIAKMVDNFALYDSRPDWPVPARKVYDKIDGKVKSENSEFMKQLMEKHPENQKHMADDAAEAKPEAAPERAAATKPTKSQWTPEEILAAFEKGMAAVGEEQSKAEKKFAPGEGIIIDMDKDDVLDSL